MIYIWPALLACMGGLLVITPLTYLKGESLSPQLAFGGGVYSPRQGCYTGVIQAEYRFGKKFCHIFRPQAILMVPQLKAAFLGIGFGVEFSIYERLIIMPSFCPGLYIQGGGKNLGYPLEFRSSLEVAYQWHKGCRIGLQLYHLSNASLGSKNPGANALAISLTIPLR